MKQFIFKTLSFVGVLFSILITSLLVLVLVNNQREKTALKINTPIILMGDSHIENAINDGDKKFFTNISQNSESYYFSYYKLLKILQMNKEVKVVVLGVSYNNLVSSFDEYSTGKYSYAISSRYFSIMPFQEKIQIVKNNLVDLPLFIKTLYKTLYSSLTVTPSYLGGYYNEFTGVAKIKSVNERINIVFYNKDGEVLNYSLHNLYYLQKINDLCKQSNISLVFISTPLHSLHKDKIPVNYLKKHQEIVNKSNRHLLDYSNLLEDAKYFMPDGDHVNKRGSISTTNIFKSQLNQILK